MSQQANANQSLIQRFGITGAPSAKAGFWRAILKGLKEGAAEEIKKLPFGNIASGVIESLLELSDQEDDEKIERRIEQIFETGEKTRQDIEAMTVLSLLIYSQVDWLVTMLESKGLPVERHQLTEFAKSAALMAYRIRVAADYQYADYRGIEGVTRYEHAASLPMDDVYITPRLLPEGDAAGLREREHSLLKSLLEYPDDIEPSRRTLMEEEFAVITGRRFRPLARLAEKELNEGMPIGEALRNKRLAVVIGGPGVGKSAMTRFLARVCALGEEAMKTKLGWSEEITPIVLPLATFVDARRSRPDLSLRDCLEEKMVERGGEALRAAVAEELRKAARC